MTRGVLVVRFFGAVGHAVLLGAGLVVLLFVFRAVLWPAYHGNWGDWGTVGVSGLVLGLFGCRFYVRPWFLWGALVAGGALGVGEGNYAMGLIFVGGLWSGYGLGIVPGARQVSAPDKRLDKDAGKRQA